jgi:2-methylisocitrate lyase-like PEP mutase family enzyme
MKLKLNRLILVADAVERISNITATDNIPAIVDALVGIAWDEEDARQIKAYHNEDLAGVDFEG